MRIFDYGKLKNALWDTEILGYVAKIRQLQGRQELYLRQKPAELGRLVESAKIQSTEASNAIEGIRTTGARLRQLVAEKAAPAGRAEEEIAGYRDVLNMIGESYEYIPLTPNHILQLHRVLFSHSAKEGIGGRYKSVQNYIEQLGADGRSKRLFTPLAPYETPTAMEGLCAAMNDALAHGEVDALILIPVFIHDFLCIHPFLDGNGRLSRLLTTLLLYRSGFEVGRYISLEAKIAAYKDLYYAALAASQEGWHEGREDVKPFVKYLLMIILSAYRELDERVVSATTKALSADKVRQAVQRQVGKFAKSDIVELCPSLSASSVEKGLKRLLDEGEIERHGAGKGTFYVRVK